MRPGQGGEKMSDLKIEVNSGNLSVLVNGEPIGRHVSKLVFIAEGKSSSVEMSLSLDGTAEFDFGEGGVTPSPFAEDLAKVVQRGEMSM